MTPDDQEHPPPAYIAALSTNIIAYHSRKAYSETVRKYLRTLKQEMKEVRKHV